MAVGGNTAAAAAAVETSLVVVVVVCPSDNSNCSLAGAAVQERCKIFPGINDTEFVWNNGDLLLATTCPKVRLKANIFISQLVAGF